MTQPIKQPPPLREAHTKLKSQITPMPVQTLWNCLDPNTQLQLTQCLAELIQRMQTSEVELRKEQDNEK